MTEIGKFNNLTIIKKLDFGLILDGGTKLGEILLPKKYAKRSWQIGDSVDVFIYHDSEDRIIATTLKPKAQVGEFAYMKVVGTSSFGSFLDWGLEKDLLVPINEQRTQLLRGQSAVVYVYLDNQTNRIAASAKIEKFLNLQPPTYECNEEVDLLVYKESDLGLNAIINGKHTGILFYNELLADLNVGESLKGYVKKVREDGKIDLSMQKQGYEKIDEVSQRILSVIKAHGGVIQCSDKSNPDYIYELFGESKKTYKKAVGSLYKQRIIKIEEDKLIYIPREEKDE